MSMGPFLKRFFPKVYKLEEEDRRRRGNNNNHYCLFNSQLLTSFTSSLYVSGFIATLLASSVTRSWGRKPSIFLGSVAFLAGSALGGSAQNVAMLIIARLLLGVGVGFANQVTKHKSLGVRLKCYTMHYLVCVFFYSRFLCISPRWRRQDTEEQSAMVSSSVLDLDF